MLVEQLPILSLALVDLRASSVIALSDLSTYATVVSPSVVNMQITPPGYPTVAVTFYPGNVNIYKCVDLGITCSDSCCPLPDGIYDVVYTVPGIIQKTFVNQEFKFIKIDQIKCKYQLAFLRVDLECSCYDHVQLQYMKELNRIKLYIDGAVAECNNSNYVLSYELYNKANIALEKLSCKFPNSKFQGCGCN